MEVGIVGGAGRVGLPFGLVLADTGYPVTLIDKDSDGIEAIESNELPFDEPGGEQLLDEALAMGRIEATTDISATAGCDVVFVVVGTPVDDHRDPDMTALMDVVDDIAEHLTRDQLLVLRSTLYPGTTDIVCERLERAGYSVGDDIYVSFAPERVVQHRAVEELRELPQLVGAPDDESYERTVALFDRFLDAECLRLTPTEAELGKLFTNIWRYLTFAAANQFYLVADSFAADHEVNIHRILDKTSQDYPRFDVPSPGANVGGPCLSKDGWFLVDDVPYTELFSTASLINEAMPAQIIDRMSDTAPHPEKVTLLGMTFKANSDDTRDSMSFKMANQLRMAGHWNLVEVEPNVDGFDDWEDVEDSDWVILVTPHDEFEDFERIRSRVDNEDCLYCDLWGIWDVARHDSDNGYFFGREVTEPVGALQDQLR